MQGQKWSKITAVNHKRDVQFAWQSVLQHGTELIKNLRADNKSSTIPGNEMVCFNIHAKTKYNVLT